MKIIAACMALALLWGCGSDGNPSPSPSPSREQSIVRLALDWTPNTNHVGFYVARSKGLFDAVGIDLEILPYATSTPETLLAAHQAECGISFQDSLTFAVAAGADIVSVAAILQRTASAIGVLADGPIQRPRDLDGKTYAGFGYPNEVPTLKAVIKSDGGTGDVRGCDARQRRLRGALQQEGRLHDPVHGVGGSRGRPPRDRPALLPFRRLRLPRVLPGRPRLRSSVARPRARRGPPVRRSDGAGLRGRHRRPGRGGRRPDRREPGCVRCEQGTSAREPRLPHRGRIPDRSTEASSAGRRCCAGEAYSEFLFEEGLLADAAGKPLTAPLDYASLFTNDFLP